MAYSYGYRPDDHSLLMWIRYSLAPLIFPCFLFALVPRRWATVPHWLVSISASGATLRAECTTKGLAGLLGNTIRPSKCERCRPCHSDSRRHTICGPVDGNWNQRKIAATRRESHAEYESVRNTQAKFGIHAPEARCAERLRVSNRTNHPNQERLFFACATGFSLDAAAFNSASASFTCARSASASKVHDRKYAETVTPASAACLCSRAHSALLRRIVTLAERRSQSPRNASLACVFKLPPNGATGKSASSCEIPTQLCASRVSGQSFLSTGLYLSCARNARS